MRQKGVLIHNNTVKNIMLRDKRDRNWFSHLLRHPARKRSGSILTTPEPSRGTIFLIILASKSIYTFASKPTLAYFTFQLQFIRVVENVHSNVTAMFSKRANKRHQIVSKHFYLFKGYSTALKLLKEFQVRAVVWNGVAVTRWS